jgi:hypothetical protein
MAPKQEAINALLEALHPPDRIVVRTPSTKLLAVIRPCTLAWKEWGRPTEKQYSVKSLNMRYCIELLN